MLILVIKELFTLPYPWTLLWWTWLHVVSQQRYIADVKKFE
jgi:hypothetical protein